MDLRAYENTMLKYMWNNYSNLVFYTLQAQKKLLVQNKVGSKKAVRLIFITNFILLECLVRNYHITQGK